MFEAEINEINVEFSKLGDLTKVDPIILNDIQGRILQLIEKGNKLIDMTIEKNR